SPILVPSEFVQRKCACGNHAMGGKCEECNKKKRFGLQTKLRMNEPGDAYEQEADRIADQVMVAPAHHTVSGALPRLQRFSGQSNGLDAAPPSVDQALASPGRPLEPVLRQDMEHRFGYDFSRVRVHTGAVAEQAARDVNASAYTVGPNIVLGTGPFNPGTDEGRRLLAHELTHVVQQTSANGNGAVAGTVQRLFGFFPWWWRSTEGGVADVTNLEQDMRDVLQEWRDAATDGGNLFVFDVLSKRIDDLESGSWKNFLVSLLGNTVWALSVFATGGAAFAIAMTGVVIAASPNVPSKSKSNVGLVARQLQDHIYGVYDQLNKGLRNSAELLIASHPGITRYRALDMFMEESFNRQFYLPPVRYDKIPLLKKERIRDWYEVSLELRLRDAEGYTYRELEEME
ncbi:MAG TPA: DUF4157 domain-containing protein, partial [Patescibacteria group bacterium]|nr:DUF4157 domain-containing protein [Patescibacteria group bacterium]